MMKMSSQNTKYDLNIRHYQFLDVVRGLAIIWICWYHIDQLMSPVRSNIAKFGYSGVSVFIIISGFGLTFSMLRNDILSSSYNNKLLTNWKSFPWKKFFLKRLFSIYPLYILAPQVLNPAIKLYNLCVLPRHNLDTILKILTFNTSDTCPYYIFGNWVYHG